MKIDFDVESREYNGRWYTDVKAWKVEMAGAATFTDAEPMPPGETIDNLDNDLPF